MDFSDKCQIIADINDEVKVLHPLLRDTFRHMDGVTEVEYTHGTNEKGADLIITRFDSALGRSHQVGVIAKRGKIVSSLDDIYRQIEECQMPRKILGGSTEARLSEVWVVNTSTISNNAKDKINHKYGGQRVEFISGEKLAELVDKHAPYFWHDISSDIGSYLADLSRKLTHRERDLTILGGLGCDDFYVVSCGTGGGLVVLRGRRCQGRTKSGRSRTLDIAAPSLTLPPGRGRQPAASAWRTIAAFPSLDRFPMIETLFTQALGLVAPWQVDQVTFTPEAGRIDFQVTFSAASHACPACGAAAQPLHDRLARSWRHLDFFQYEAHLHAEVPRVACAGCGKVTQIPVPWAREGSRFTLLFEALTLMLAPTMSVLAAGRLLRVRSRRLWRVIEHHVAKRAPRKVHAEVRAIGVDETASKRGQTYITVFHDLDKPRLLFATPGRDKATLGMFATDLTEHGGQPSAITHVSMDMSGSFQAGAAEHFPEAEVCFDRFHVVALGSTALDEVRRAEVKSEPELKGTRWSLHKKPADWTIKQTQTMHWLQRSNLKTARAWRIKEALRAIYATAKTPDEAKPLFKRWLSWASRCRLEPFKRLGRTITKHLPGVLNGFESGKHNGRVEAMNRALQEARARARGYRRVENFIAMAYLIAGKLIHLPVSPFVPFRPVPHETT
jgi:transposase